jgi:hypothetical protein
MEELIQEEADSIEGDVDRIRAVESQLETQLPNLNLTPTLAQDLTTEMQSAIAGLDHALQQLGRMTHPELQVVDAVIAQANGIEWQLSQEVQKALSEAADEQALAAVIGVLATLGDSAASSPAVLGCG